MSRSFVPSLVAAPQTSLSHLSFVIVVISSLARYLQDSLAGFMDPEEREHLQGLSNAHRAFDKRGRAGCCVLGESGHELDKPVKKTMRDQR